MPDVKVYTETTCSRCGFIDRREGSCWDMLPPGWVSLYGVVYGNKGEPYESYRRIAGTLCPACLEHLESFLGEGHSVPPLSNRWAVIQGGDILSLPFGQVLQEVESGPPMIVEETKGGDILSLPFLKKG